MADDQSTAASGLTIPPDVQEKFGDLVALIIASDSMNTEERQYWINILPIMTPEQIKDLQTILVNEKTQLAAIDQKYAKEIDQMGQAQVTAQTEEERRRRRDERRSKEQTHRAEEERNTEDLLKKIEG